MYKRKEKSTPKKRGRPKKSVKKASPKMPTPKSSPKSSPKMSFDEALEKYRRYGGAGTYRKLMNSIKKEFKVTLKYDNHGDEYALPDLYFMKGKKECSYKEVQEVKEYVIDYVKKNLPEKYLIKIY